MNSWIFLIIAGIFEMLWVISLKLSETFTKIIPAVLTVIFMILSLIFLGLSFKTIPMGTAYACWTAIGAISILIVGMLFFGESTSLIRILFLVMIVVGIVGLKITTA